MGWTGGRETERLGGTLERGDADTPANHSKDAVLGINVCTRELKAAHNPGRTTS